MAASLHRDDRSFRFGNAHQSPWNRDPCVAGIEHVGAQDHAARVEASIVPNRRGGQGDLLLRHILMRPGSQALGKLAFFCLRQFGPEDGLHSA
jgi:hypothetical protein